MESPQNILPDTRTHTWKHIVHKCQCNGRQIPCVAQKKNHEPLHIFRLAETRWHEIFVLPCSPFQDYTSKCVMRCCAFIFLSKTNKKRFHFPLTFFHSFYKWREYSSYTLNCGVTVYTAEGILFKWQFSLVVSSAESYENFYLHQRSLIKYIKFFKSYIYLT